MRRVSWFTASDSGCAGNGPPTGKMNASARFLIAALSTGAAAMYATTIVCVFPGLSVKGPDDWKNRMSSGVVGM